MALTPERIVKNKTVAILKSYGVYYFYPVTGGYGMSGVPDIIACYKGKFIAIECKAGRNPLSALQHQNIKRIAEAGGRAIVVNEDNLHEVEQVLTDIDKHAVLP